MIKMLETCHREINLYSNSGYQVEEFRFKEIRKNWFTNRTVFASSIQREMIQDLKNAMQRKLCIIGQY